MRRHPTDPVAAVLGLMLIAAAVSVAVFRLDRLDDNTAVILAAAALFAALVVIPWHRPRADDDADQTAPGEHPLAGQ